MKKLFSLLLTAILIFSLTAAFAGCNDNPDNPSPDDSKAETLPLLKASGNDLVDEDGNVVVIKGVNLGGWLVQESWMCPTDAKDQKTAYSVLTERFGKAKMKELFKIYEDNFIVAEDFVNIKNLGFNCVRIPFTFWNLQDEQEDYTVFDRLDFAVEECRKNGLYVILDLHGAKGSQNGRDHSGDTSQVELFDDKTNWDDMVYLWSMVADHFKDSNTVLGYDLLNEPEGKLLFSMPNPQFAFYNDCYKAIREMDDRHIIIMEAVWETYCLPNPADYEWENVMYEYHNYGWGDENHDINDFSYQKDFIDKKIRDYKNLKYSVPKFIGEFTLFDNYAAWKYAIDSYLENGIGYTIWTYKVVAKTSAWGLYNGTPEKVNIESDSYEEIAAKWSAVKTSESYRASLTYYFFKSYNGVTEG